MMRCMMVDGGIRWKITARDVSSLSSRCCCGELLMNLQHCWSVGTDGSVALCMAGCDCSAGPRKELQCEL